MHDATAACVFFMLFDIKVEAEFLALKTQFLAVVHII